MIGIREEKKESEVVEKEREVKTSGRQKPWR